MGGAPPTREPLAMALRTLFLDFNSYFASVEQHVRPDLRGRPVAVAPVTGDTGSCIAASYEAKAFGVRTGTRVGEAKRLCPGLVIVDARPRLYVRMHNRILKAIDTQIPVEKVHSIDEVSCVLDRTQRTREAARDLSLRVKRAVAERCGRTMRCSIGVAPNRALAKLATDLFKPDGLTIWDDQDIPGAFAHLSPQELAGIGPKTMERLRRAGITTIAQLLECDEKRMHALWGSVWGERWHEWLRGRDVHEPRTRRSSLSHQHVLPPDQRTREGARAVAFRLMLKAGARLRHEGYVAGKLTLSLRFAGEAEEAGWGKGHWDAWAPLGAGVGDSLTMLDALTALWDKAPRDKPILLVGVVLSDLQTPASTTLPLFGEENKRGRLSKAMDVVNNKFGASTLYTANMQDARSSAGGGIAFHFVPDLTFHDSVRARQATEGQRGKPLTDAEIDHLIEAGLRADRAGTS